MRIFYFLFIVLRLLPAQVSLAADCSEGVKTKVYFGNGMFNSPDEAVLSLKELEKLGLSSLESSPSRLGFELAFNRSEHFLAQFLEVGLQRLGPNTTPLWQMLFGLHQMLPEVFQDMVELYFAYSGSPAEEMIKQSERYLKEYTEGNKVILVSHSQGNLFSDALEIAADHFKDKYLDSYDAYPFVGRANIQVASPLRRSDLKKVPYGLGIVTPWVTFGDDAIMNAVRALLSGTLPATLGNIGAGPAPVKDPNGHNFIKAYLSTHESRKFIRDNVLKLGEIVPYSSRNIVSIKATGFFPKSSDQDITIWTMNEDMIWFPHISSKTKLGGEDESSSWIKCNRTRPGTAKIELLERVDERDSSLAGPRIVQIEVGKDTFIYEPGSKFPADRVLAEVQITEPRRGKFEYEVKTWMKQISRQ